MTQIRLKAEKEELILTGYPRVLRADVAEITGDFEPGDVAAVLDSSGEWVGSGFINPFSRVCVRMLSFDQEEDINDEFFYRKLEEAKVFREKIVAVDEDAYRAVFSESDGLPGLIVDKFGDYLVMQILTMGIEVRREFFVKALRQLFSPEGIFERSKGNVRKHELLSPRIAPAYGKCPDVIPFHQRVGPQQFPPLHLFANVKRGQKTGFFLDQRDNRRAFAKYVQPGDRVLDCFCYTGSFALTAAQKGAFALGVDVAERAISLAKEAAAINGLGDLCRFEIADVFDRLRELELGLSENKDLRPTRHPLEPTLFDAIVLDPPAFTRHKGGVKNALRGYYNINLRAMRLLRPGGILMSCSCTQQIDENTFLEMLREAAWGAKRSLRFLEIRGQSPDHSILADLPETRYLKCVIAQVL